MADVAGIGALSATTEPGWTESAPVKRLRGPAVPSEHDPDGGESGRFCPRTGEKYIENDDAVVEAAQ